MAGACLGKAFGVSSGSYRTMSRNCAASTARKLSQSAIKPESSPGGELFSFRLGSAGDEVCELASGAHAATVSVPILAGVRFRIGGTAFGEDSFPLTDGGHLPADRMFLAALTSRS
jgi:hypothetical protein